MEDPLYKEREVFIHFTQGDSLSGNIERLDYYHFSHGEHGSATVPYMILKTGTRRFLIPFNNIRSIELLR